MLHFCRPYRLQHNTHISVLTCWFQSIHLDVCVCHGQGVYVRWHTALSCWRRQWLLPRTHMGCGYSSQVCCLSHHLPANSLTTILHLLHQLWTGLSQRSWNETLPARRLSTKSVFQLLNIAGFIMFIWSPELCTYWCCLLMWPLSGILERPQFGLSLQMTFSN